GKLITAASVNPKKAHMLRYPVDDFARELPARRILSLTRRGKHLVFATEVGGGGSPRWLVINPMLGGRFQLEDGEVAVPATAVFTAIPAVLDRAVEAILANPKYEESKQDRSFMAVHMKGGKTCPRCGHRISQLGTNREPLNFCRGCQL